MEAPGTGLRAAGNHNEILTDRDLTECDYERLERIGTIQPNCGYFFSFHYPTGKVLAYSANARELEWINKKQEKLPTFLRPAGFLTDWFPQNICDTVFELVASMMEAKSQRNFHFEAPSFCDYEGAPATPAFALSVSAASAPDYDTIGLEVETVEALNPAAQFSSTLVHLGRIIEFYNHNEIAQNACTSVYHLMQGAYDRGMVYKFHDDLSGEIVYEIKKNWVETSYQGLRFPASDIPLTSRLLYIKNRVRYIHDCTLEAIPILCSDEGDPREVDLTHIRMRGVDLCHVAYLNNIGVTSTMSMAIVVEGELWGVLAFHAYRKTHKPTLHQRIACETISSMVSVRIESLMKKAQVQRIVRVGDMLQNLKQDVSVIHNMYNWGEHVLEVLDADIMVCRVSEPRAGEGDEYAIGDKSLLPTLDFWSTMALRPHRHLTVESNRQGLNKLGLSTESCPASGIVFFQEGRTMVMLGRGTKVKDVAWGGNPDEPKTRVNGRLHPRGSFNEFIEKARCESRAWSTQDIDVISVMRDRICEHSHQYNMGLLRENIEETNERYMSAVQRARDNYEFFAHMSHELRTPFHGVMGCLDILDEGIDSMAPHDVRDVVDTAIVSGNHMINLLNEILEISKNKHLSHVLAEDQVIYQTLAFETIDAMKALATSRNLTLTSSIEPNGEDKHMIVTDKTKTIQVVSNIVNNAIKFTDKTGFINIDYRLVHDLRVAVGFLVEGAKTHHGIAFTMQEDEMITDIDVVLSDVVSPYVQDPKRRWMAVSISDTGCGMNPTEIVEMFRPYTQANAGSNKTVQGTGLGLFICVSLCFQLGGFIACASTPGVGTVFHLGLPVGLSSSNETLEEETEETEALLPIRMTGPILVVDDNVVNVKILKRALVMELKKAGKEILILTASGGEEGVALYKEKLPSLCIVDYHMPGTDGIQATQKIREFETQHSIHASHIMIYSADVTDQANTRIMGAGSVDELMPKPPPRGFILELVQRLDLAE